MLSMRWRIQISALKSILVLMAAVLLSSTVVPVNKKQSLVTICVGICCACVKQIYVRVCVWVPDCSSRRLGL
ncbi:hypothetical protein J3F83DRAFT_723680 [Trichoderma novae-zelandiae]